MGRRVGLAAEGSVTEQASKWHHPAAAIPGQTEDPGKGTTKTVSLGAIRVCLCDRKQVLPICLRAQG